MRMRSPDQAISDSTIGAVAFLSLGCTKLKGTLIAAKTTESTLYVNALERMVEMRGGFQALGMKGVLHMLVSWYVIKGKAESPRPFLIAKSLPRQDLSSSR